MSQSGSAKASMSVLRATDMNWFPFNTEVLRNPYNWLVIGLMVAILMLGLHLIFAPASSSTPTGDSAEA